MLECIETSSWENACNSLLISNQEESSLDTNSTIAKAQPTKDSKNPDLLDAIQSSYVVKCIK
jgi:hypothetical protein